MPEQGLPRPVAKPRLLFRTESDNSGVQMLHVGQKGLTFHGLRHEIYLSDPRRVAPARLRTVLRHPVE